MPTTCKKSRIFPLAPLVASSVVARYTSNNNLHNMKTHRCHKQTTMFMSKHLDSLASFCIIYQLGKWIQFTSNSSSITRYRSESYRQLKWLISLCCTKIALHTDESYRLTIVINWLRERCRENISHATTMTTKICAKLRFT